MVRQRQLEGVEEEGSVEGLVVVCSVLPGRGS